MRDFDPFQIIPMRLYSEREIGILAICPIVSVVKLTDFGKNLGANKQYGCFSVAKRPLVPMTVKYTITEEWGDRVGVVACADRANLWSTIEDGKSFI